MPAVGVASIQSSPSQATGPKHSSFVLSSVAVVHVLELPPFSGVPGKGAVPFLTPDPAALAAQKKLLSQPGFQVTGRNVVSDQASATSGVTVVSNYPTALDFDQSGGWYPPDPIMAAGPGYVVEMANVVWEYWTKTGSALSAGTTSNLYGLFATTDSIGDPRIMFDGASSNRWIASVYDMTDNSVRLAFSATSDPLTWYVFEIFAPKGDFPDQPTIGVSDDKVAVSANLYGCNMSCFVGDEYWIVNKSELLACTVQQCTGVNVDQYLTSSSLWSVHPAHSLSSTSTLYLATDAAPPPVPPAPPCSTSLLLLAVTGVPGVLTGGILGTSVSQYPLPIDCITSPPNAQQKGSTILVDTADFRAQDVEWYQGALWFAANDACIPGNGDTATRSCIRFIKVMTSGPTVAQDFDYSAPWLYYYYPALSLDASGDMGAVFAFSSSNDYPGLKVTGEAAGTTTLFASQLLQAGSTSQTSGRYGDYFGAAVDPSNTALIWVVGEFGGNSYWNTDIGSITFSTNPDFFMSASPASLTIPQTGSGSSTITLTSLNAFSGTVTLTLSGCPLSFSTCSLSSTSVSLSLGGSGTSYLSISVATTSPGSYDISVQGTALSGTLSHTTTVSVTVPDFLISASPSSQSIQQGLSGSYAVTVTSVNGFNSAVSLTLSGCPALPSTCMFSPTSVTPPSGGIATSTLTVTVGSSTLAKTYTLTITGTSASITHPTSVGLTIITPSTMTVSYSVVGGGSPTAPVFYYVLYGVTKSLTLTLGTSCCSVQVDSGSTWSVSPNPLGGSTSSERWYSSQSLIGTASSTAIVFTYQHQYYLTMQASPSGAGSVTPSSGWYNSGQTITIKATANSHHKFKSWTGTGTGSYTGTKSSTTITMNSAITETANFT